jgi:dCTP diphosphatase
MNKDLIEKILKFRDERNWKQFHTPENLAKSISIEAAELLENFQWNNNNNDLEDLKDEIADIYIYLLLFSKHFDFDLEEIAFKKVMKNEQKYPVKLSKNNSTKYTKFKK